MYLSNIMGPPVRDRDMGHRRVWKFFDLPDGTPRDFIYRWDKSPQRTHYTVLSPRLPCNLIEGWHMATEPYQPQWQAGDVHPFQVRFYARVRKKEADGAMKEMGLLEEGIRLPLTWLSEEYHAEVSKAMATAANAETA